MFFVKIKTDTAACDTPEKRYAEVARILRALADDVEKGEDQPVALDAMSRCVARTVYEG